MFVGKLAFIPILGSTNENPSFYHSFVTYTLGLVNHETYLLFLSERGLVEKNHAFDLTYQFRLLITMICPRLISKEQVLRTCYATCKSRNKLMGIVTPFCVT